MKYTYDEHLKPIITGDIDLPNFKAEDAALVLSNIAATGHSMEPRWGYAKIKGRKIWAQYFLFGAGMSAPPYTYGGDGYVIAYPNIVGRFNICEHEFEMGAGANPSRGWRPGRCKKCGLDMSIDSGD